MITPEATQWLADLPGRAKLYSIAFVQLGHAAADIRQALVDVPGSHVKVGDYLSDELTALPSPIFLYDFDRMRKNRGEKFGALRDRVMREALTGVCFVFVSISPKAAYPDTKGSDVIADAKQIFAPLAMTFPTGGWIPAEAHPSSDELDFFVQCVRELGDRTVIALSEAMWDSQLSLRDCLEPLTRPDVEALRGAGFMQADGTEVSWCITAPQLKMLKVAAAQVCSESDTPSDWVASSFVEIWTLERDLRNIIRLSLMEKLEEGWRETCLPEHLRGEVLDRARKDTQPGANKLGDLRDPLEWLTTSELLDLRELRELGGLGLQPYLWTKLRNEIVPIRNKIAHMRLISEQDAQRAAIWRKLVAQRTASRT